MKSIYKILLVALFFVHTSCNEKQNSNNRDSASSDQTSDLKVGGLYILKNKDNTYYLTKVLVIDDFAIHIRTYKQIFKTKPIDVNSDTLKFLIGHAPLDKTGFLIDKPELLKVEKVKDSELEGYKMYLEAMTESK